MKNILIATCLFLMLMPAAYSADLKIGVVDVNKVWSEAPQTNAFDAAMNERFGARGKELENMQEELKTLQDNYNRNELVMTADKLNEMRSAMTAKYQQFKQKDVVLRQEMNTMRNQELATLQQTTQEIINQIAKDDKFDLILGDGVIHAADTLYISDKVLAGLKKAHKKK